MSATLTPPKTDQPDRTVSPATTSSPTRAKRTVSRSQRRAEIVIAALFLSTAAAAIAGGLLVDPIVNGSDYLTKMYPDRATIEWGSLLISINNIGIVFIAVFAFPLLRRLNEALATGYLAVRIVEGTLMMVGIVATLLLIPLSQDFINAGASHGAWFATLGDILKHAKSLGLSVLSTPMLGLGGLIFTSMLFQFRLVPRSIAVVGLIGYALLIVMGIAGWFGLVDPSAGGNGTVLALPVAGFEIILLPFWLFFKGFRMPEAPERV